MTKPILKIIHRGVYSPIKMYSCYGDFKNRKTIKFNEVHINKSDSFEYGG